MVIGLHPDRHDKGQLSVLRVELCAKKYWKCQLDRLKTGREILLAVSGQPNLDSSPIQLSYMSYAKKSLTNKNVDSILGQVCTAQPGPGIAYLFVPGSVEGSACWI